jgi:hypothetical protein
VTRATAQAVRPTNGTGQVHVLMSVMNGAELACDPADGQSLDGVEPLSRRHPDFLPAQRDVALAGDPAARLRALERQALYFGKLVAARQIERPDALDGLLEIATSNGLCRTAQDRGDIEHIVGQGLAGISALAPAPDRGGISSLRDGVTVAASDWRSKAVAASDLRTKTFASLLFVVPKLIPEGVTILASKPKTGKSWLMLDVCLAAAAGRFTLGSLKPAHGDVLYLALEDSQRRLQRRVDKLLSPFDESWPNRLTLATEWRRTHDGGIADIEDWAGSVPEPKLVVVDTLEKIRPPVTGKSQAYSTDYEAITGLHALAIRYGLAVVVIHHVRKMEADDPFDTVSGTLGLTGAADTVLVLKRQSSGITLFARGRDIEESESAIQFDKATCRWTILGAATEVYRSDERGRIIAALKDSGSQGLAVKEIMLATGMTNRGNVDVLLYKMKGAGEIASVRRGHYSLPAPSAGKIAKKERSVAQAIELATKRPDLTGLTDRAGRAGEPLARAAR